mmetsp:Transcript_34099/g.61475  ORF Transcript_34099/g.61475 Transcript_34099/m.61475 type:complete len:824 (-) Transcript_34099:41-2512(-)
MSETIQVSCPQGSRIQFFWGLGTELYTIPLNTASSTSSYSRNFQNIQWGGDTSTARLITLESLPHFIDLQKAKQNGNAQIRNEALLKYSTKVCEAINNQLERDTGSTEMSKIDLMLWQLIEIFWAHSQNIYGFIGEDLAAWLRTHLDTLCLCTGATSPSTYWTELMSFHSSPGGAESHESFWPLICRLAAFGDTDSATKLLQQHSILRIPLSADTSPTRRSQIELLDSVCSYMRQMPRLVGARTVSPRAYGTLSEFGIAWSRWMHSIQSTLENSLLFDAMLKSDPSSAAGVKKLLLVLLGQTDSLEVAVVEAGGGMIELLVSELVFRRPGSGSGLIDSLDAAVTRIPPPESHAVWATPLYEILKALMSYDAMEVTMKLSNSEFCNAWLLAHITEFLIAFPSSSLRTVSTSTAARMMQTPMGADLAEYYRMMWLETQFPVALGSNNVVSGGLVSGGNGSSGILSTLLTYLAWCPVLGLSASEQLLQNVPLPYSGRDVASIEKLGRRAQRLGLVSASMDLYRRTSIADWLRGSLPSSLSWMLQAYKGTPEAHVLADGANNGALEINNEGNKDYINFRQCNVMLSALLLPMVTLVESFLLSQIVKRAGGGGGEASSILPLELLPRISTELATTGMKSGDCVVTAESMVEDLALWIEGSSLIGRAEGKEELRKGVRFGNKLDTLVEGSHKDESSVVWPTVFLYHFAKLSEAVRVLRRSTSSDVNSLALEQGLKALLALAKKRCVPTAMVTPVLLFSIPLLEAVVHSPEAAEVDSEGIIGLLRWMEECGRSGLRKVITRLKIADVATLEQSIKLAIIRAASSIRIMGF